MTADEQIAAVVATDHQAIRDLSPEIQELIPVLPARQQPVASDLRLVLAAVHANTDMDRRGALAAHVAKIGMAQAPRLAVPSEALPTLLSMAEAFDAGGDIGERGLESRVGVSGHGIRHRPVQPFAVGEFVGERRRRQPSVIQDLEVVLLGRLSVSRSTLKRSRRSKAQTDAPAGEPASGVAWGS